MTHLQTLQREYYELLSLQQFDSNALDYGILDTHTVLLHQLAQVGNSGITVFDHHRREHVFTSYNFGELFGHDMDAVAAAGSEYFDSRIHPDDLVQLLQNGIAALKFYHRIPEDERRNYKYVCEYRVIGNTGSYVRVIEQHQPLEIDARGNIWLTLGVLDISPNQDETQGIKAQFLNYKTGVIVPLVPKNDTAASLTKREKEILTLVKKGLPSKDISEKLFISIHTVNTHRQRILEKLNVVNSLEAARYASELGLLE